MKLRVRGSEGLPLSAPTRSLLEQKIRLAIGIRANEIQSLRVDLHHHPGPPNRIQCCVSLKCVDGKRTRLEEDAENVEKAIEWAVWRVNHLLGRQALRERARFVVESPDSKR